MPERKVSLQQRLARAAFAVHGLTPTEKVILSSLAVDCDHNGDNTITARELASRSACAPATVKTALRSFRNLGVVYRHPSGQRSTHTLNLRRLLRTYERNAND